MDRPHENVNMREAQGLASAFKAEFSVAYEEMNMSITSDFAFVFDGTLEVGNKMNI